MLHSIYRDDTHANRSKVSRMTLCKCSLSHLILSYTIVSYIISSCETNERYLCNYMCSNNDDLLDCTRKKSMFIEYVNKLRSNYGNLQHTVLMNLFGSKDNSLQAVGTVRSPDLQIVVISSLQTVSSTVFRFRVSLQRLN